MGRKRTLVFLTANLSAGTLLHAGIIITHDAGTPTPGLPGFTTYIVTATNLITDDPITGVDFYGSGAIGSQTARGFFGPLGQVNPGGVPTVFQHDNFIHPVDPQKDSHFLFPADGPGAVIAPPGFSSESGTSLRALFTRAGGFNKSVALAQLVIPDGSEVFYRGCISIPSTGTNVAIPEIRGVVPTPGNVQIPNIVALDLGATDKDTITAHLLVAGFPTITWNNLTPVSGSPALPATLSPSGEFQWSAAGSPRGANAVYSWSATATNAYGTDTSLAISLVLQTPSQPPPCCSAQPSSQQPLGVADAAKRLAPLSHRRIQPLEATVSQ